MVKASDFATSAGLLRRELSIVTDVIGALVVCLPRIITAGAKRMNLGYGVTDNG